MNTEEEDELNSLISEVSNASFDCGKHNDEHDGDGYEVLLEKAHSSEEKLRKFVRRFAN